VVFQNLIFRFLQNKARVQVWLFENTELRIEGRIVVCPICLCNVNSLVELTEISLALQGFDEYMNLVLDDAEELSIKKKTRKALGRILLKGDNITLMMSVYAATPPTICRQ